MCKNKQLEISCILQYCTTSWKKKISWEKVDRFPIFSSHWKMKAKGGLFHMWKLFRHLLYFKDLGIINFLKYASMPILQTNVSRLVKLQIPEVVWIKCGFWKNSNLLIVNLKSQTLIHINNIKTWFFNTLHHHSAR